MNVVVFFIASPKKMMDLWANETDQFFSRHKVYLNETCHTTKKYQREIGEMNFGQIKNLRKNAIKKRNK